ncbi:MAG TPA: hypothetical protein VJI13_04305 [Candidatus Norongarragalinales archaeon]|nr:hypothetical protein [Candidatus Norongarragalinales archaeon]
MRFAALVLLLLTITGFAFAITPAEITEAENLITSNQNCISLSSGQLELIGEYVMERMHPGEAHEFMHRMMGLEEGSEDEGQFHINLAKSIYCGDSSNYGMMGGGVRGNMMRGMMGYGTAGTGYGNGMMGNYGNGGIFGWNIFELLVAILLVGLIVLVYLSVWNKAKESGKVKK